MWTSFEILVETLVGNIFEVTCKTTDTIGYIKSRIQKYEGIPVSQQHLIYNHKELIDSAEIKDVPLAKGSKLKLVLDMKGGPVSAKRVVTLPDYDSWIDLSDVFNTSRQDQLTISTPGVKLLVYKDCKKNIHRVMKLRTDRKISHKGMEGQPELPQDDSQDDQWLKDNIQTLEKMHQLRSKMDFKNGKKPPTQQLQEQSKHQLNNENDKLEGAVFLQPPISKPNQFRTRQRTFNKTSTATTNNTATDNILDGIIRQHMSKIEHIRPKTCSRPLNLTTAHPQEKSNFAKFFNHRNSSPTLNLPPSLNDALEKSQNQLNKTKLSQSCNYIGERAENCRSKLRENIRRNRSFKVIENDFIIEENQAAESPSRTYSYEPYEPAYEQNYKKVQTDDDIMYKASTSVHDLIDKFNFTKINNKSEENLKDFKIKSSNFDNSNYKFNKRLSTPNCSSSTGFGNKVLVDRHQNYSLYGREQMPCSNEFKLDNASASLNGLDGSFRVYKMTSDAKNCYELPKLLIREDSPVESFQLSDPQLKTLALRCESPKTSIDTSVPVQEQQNKTIDDENLKESKEPILQLYDSSNQNQREQLLNMYETPGVSKSNWDHHHSDLGLNKLELNFLNDELSDGFSDGASMGCLKKSNSVLKIASNLEINKWKQSPQYSNKGQEATASFQYSDISSDDEDAFNSCELLHNNKSKSVELNELRMMFGSSPTLLSTNLYNVNSMTQSSRLDAVPFQYRRGYTNLNDACLSSSTSDLECLHNSNKKKSSKNVNSELPSLLRHRNNEHLDYMRSYENLDRAKILRMRNEKGSGAGGTATATASSTQLTSTTSSSSTTTNKKDSHRYSRDRLRDPYDDFSFSNLRFKNSFGSSCVGGGDGDRNNNNCDGSSLPLGYPSDESLFNINFDTFEDDVIEIDTMGLFETSGASQLSSLDTLNDDENCCNNNNNLIINTNQLILPDISDNHKNSDSLIKKCKKLRCAECNKKLGVIMIMKCHCEKLFCAQHRYAEAHNCTYNFKMEGKKILAKENPQVIAQKLPKI